MVGPAIGQGVHRIHFRHSQGLLGRVLNHKFLAVGLGQPLGGKGVTVAILGFEGLGIEPLVLLDFFKGRQQDGGQTLVQLLGFVYRSVDVGDVLHIHSGVQGIRDFHDAFFTHAVHQKVRLSVQQNRALHTVGPVIVVAQTAQTGFNSADENGYVFIGLPDQVTVHDGGIIRALSHDAAGGKGIGFPPMAGDGIVVHHGVHVAAADQKAQPGPAKGRYGLGILPIGLRDDAHAVAPAFQNTADNGVAEGRVIHIGITNDIYKVRLRNAPGFHFAFGNG